MGNLLRVEELEKRELLNGASYSPQPPPAHPGADGARTARAPEAASAVEVHGDRDASFGQNRHGEGESRIDPSWNRAPEREEPERWTSAGAHETGRYRSDAPTHLDDRTPEPAPRYVLAPRDAARTEFVSVESVPLVVVPDIIDSAGTERNDSAAAPPAVPKPSSDSRGVDVTPADLVPAAAPERANPPSPLPVLAGLLAAPVLRVDAQDPSVAGPPVGAVRERDSIFSYQNLCLRYSERSVPIHAAAPPAPALDGGPEEAPPPRPPEPAGGLPPHNLADLERGLQRFLEGLEEAGLRLVGDPDGTGLRLWVVAGTAAVIACEIGRRQLRRPGLAPGGELPRTPGSLPDHLFVG